MVLSLLNSLGKPHNPGNHIADGEQVVAVKIKEQHYRPYIEEVECV